MSPVSLHGFRASLLGKQVTMSSPQTSQSASKADTVFVKTSKGWDMKQRPYLEGIQELGNKRREPKEGDHEHHDANRDKRPSLGGIGN